MHTICFVARSLRPDDLTLGLALGLADFGEQVHLVLAPTDASEPEPEHIPTHPLLITHTLPTEARGGPFRWLRRRRHERNREEAVSRLIREIAPRVVHVEDEADCRLAIAAGMLRVQGVSEVPSPRRSLVAASADAFVLPDGRFLDRNRRPMEFPGVPPLPSAGLVDDGLDPVASAAHWRVLCFLAGIDALRRERRVRFDSPHQGVPAARVSSPRPSVRPAESVGAG